MKRYRACLKIGAYCGLACVLTACDDYNTPPIYISTDGATPTALIQGSDGNFYGTTADGGQFATGTVFKVTASGTETLLYSFGASPTDGAAPVSLIEGSAALAHKIGSNPEDWSKLDLPSKSREFARRAGVTRSALPAECAGPGADHRDCEFHDLHQ